MVGGPQALRLSTFNIKRGTRPDGEVDIPLLVEACRSLDADVLALQEVIVGEVDTVAVLADALGMSAVFVEAVVARAGGGYGNALLVRGELRDVEELFFRDDTEPRSAVVATAAVEGIELSIATGHLGLRGQATGELPVVLDALDRRLVPRVVLGDLNLTLVEATPIIEAHGLHVVDAGPTFPVRKPNRQLDHVAVVGLTVRRAEVVHLPVSDHRALVVECSTD